MQTHFLSLNWSLGVAAAAERHLDGRKEGGEKGVGFFGFFFAISLELLQLQISALRPYF